MRIGPECETFVSKSLAQQKSTGRIDTHLQLSPIMYFSNPNFLKTHRSDFNISVMPQFPIWYDINGMSGLLNANSKSFSFKGWIEASRQVCTMVVFQLTA